MEEIIKQIMEEATQFDICKIQTECFSQYESHPSKSFWIKCMIQILETINAPAYDCIERNQRITNAITTLKTYIN